MAQLPGSGVRHLNVCQILSACAFGGGRDTTKVYTLPLCLTSLLATAATTGKGSAIGKGEAEGWRGEVREESWEKWWEATRLGKGWSTGVVGISDSADCQSASQVKMGRVIWRDAERALQRQGLGPGQGLRLWSLITCFAGAALCCFFGRGTGRERFTGSGPWKAVLSAAALFWVFVQELVESVKEVVRLPPRDGTAVGAKGSSVWRRKRTALRPLPSSGHAASTPPRLMLWRARVGEGDSDSGACQDTPLRPLTLCSQGAFVVGRKRTAGRTFVGLQPRPAPKWGAGGGSERL